MEEAISDIRTTQRFLGHKDIGTTQRYLKENIGSLRKRMEKMTVYMDSLRQKKVV